MENMENKLKLVVQCEEIVCKDIKINDLNNQVFSV
jgi:hypothetical protein